MPLYALLWLNFATTTKVIYFLGNDYEVLVIICSLQLKQECGFKWVEPCDIHDPLLLLLLAMLFLDNIIGKRPSRLLFAWEKPTVLWFRGSLSVYCGISSSWQTSPSVYVLRGSPYLIILKTQGCHNLIDGVLFELRSLVSVLSFWHCTNCHRMWCQWKHNYFNKVEPAMGSQWIGAIEWSGALQFDLIM